MTELLDWVEKQGLENIRGHLQTMEHLTKEAHATLVLVLAGVGGSVAFVIKLMEAKTIAWPLLWAAASFGGCLIVASIMLVVTCLKVGAYPSPTNEPMRLFQPDYTLDQLRRVELKNLQERINQAAARNGEVATWLNRARFVAITSPGVALAAGFLVAGLQLALCE